VASAGVPYALRSITPHPLGGPVDPAREGARPTLSLRPLWDHLSAVNTVHLILVPAGCPPDAGEYGSRVLTGQILP
jgi:hypothetical protein